MSPEIARPDTAGPGGGARITPRSGRRLRLGAVALSAALAGCAAPPEAPPRAPVFYPPPPNPPRLQYLASFSGPSDVEAQPSAFDRVVFGDDERGEDTVAKPYGVAAHAGAIFVVDERGARYAVFDLKEHELRYVRGDGAGRLVKPVNIAVDADGSRYVADMARGQIVVFDAADNYVRAVGDPARLRPADAVVAGDRLYVADPHDHRVLVLDKRSGAELAAFGRAGSGDGELFYPTNLALGPGGDVYVSETGNFRVQRFTADGRFVRTYGGVGSAPGRFARPKGVGVDREGRIHVVDAAFENVQVFDDGGRLLLWFGQASDGRAGLDLPAGLAIDYDNLDFYRRYAAPDFELEYVVLVASQFGAGKVRAYGFGRMRGIDYEALDQASQRAMRGDEGTP